MTMRTIRFFLGFAGVLACVQPSLALDINTFRAQHKLPPLAVSAALSGAAYAHAQDLARRRQLDHANFRARMDNIVSGAAAENVLVGCDDSACAYRKWASSPGHRRNMLMPAVTHYGLASATGENGRRYWVLELGN